MRNYISLGLLAVLAVGCAESPTAPSKYSPLMGSSPGGRFEPQAIRPLDGVVNDILPVPGISCPRDKPELFAEVTVHDTGRTTLDVQWGLNERAPMVIVTYWNYGGGDNGRHTHKYDTKHKSDGTHDAKIDVGAGGTFNVMVEYELAPGCNPRKSDAAFGVVGGGGAPLIVEAPKVCYTDPRAPKPTVTACTVQG